MNLLIKEDFNSWRDNCIKDAIKFSEESIDVCVHIIFSYDAETKRENAHALEFDIVSEEKTKKKALKELLIAIVNHISFCIVFENQDKIISSVPDEYWMEFYEKLKDDKVEMKTQIPRRLNFTSQMPYRQSRFTQICTTSA